MNSDTVLKVLPVLATIAGAAKILYEIPISARSRLREEYKFAREFMQELRQDPEMHPFVREKGYQAIAGDRSLSADEVAYVLSLQNPEQALRDYVLARPYLEHRHRSGNIGLGFRAKYQRPWSRMWRKMAYSTLYFLLAALAFSPFLFSKVFGLTGSQIFVALGVYVITFGWFAWQALIAAARIFRAEKLVKNQSRHTCRIILD